MLVPYLCRLFTKRHFPEDQDIRMPTCFFVFVLTLAFDFPW